MSIFNKNFLAKEIVKWREQGIIDATTAEKIAAPYGIDLNNIRDTTALILKLVAYLFFAGAFFTLIGSNWEEFPRVVRLLIVLFVLAFVNLGGLFTLKNGNENGAAALFFLGNFCYGAAIALIAQIYHLGEHMPDGVLLWSIGSFALSLAAGRSILAAQSLAIAFLWFCMELEFGVVMHEILIFIALGCYMLYKESSKFLTGILFVGIFIYLSATILNIISFGRGIEYILFEILFKSIVFFGLSYSLLGIGVSYVLTEFKKFEVGESLKSISISCGVTTLLAVTVLSGFDYYDLFGFERANEITVFYKSVFGYTFTALVAFSFFIFLRFKNYYLLFLCAVLFILPALSAWLGNYFSAILSLLSVITGAILIKQDRLQLGLFVIFSVAIVRYVDLIGDYVGASLLFVIFAVTVLLISKKRGAK
ncbi:MAG: DUF2157 domain-containing protein [Campylobacter sp.]|nr:DUF2157 domain-containing protein [Campylobacter sp.]